MSRKIALPKPDPEKLLPQCPHCHKRGPAITGQSHDLNNGFVMMVFFCVSCKKILSVQMLPGGSGKPLIVVPGGKMPEG